MLTTPPTAIALGQATEIPPPSSSVRFVTVVLANLSPMICAVELGGAAQTLQPWTADRYSFDNTAGMVTITPAATTVAGTTTGTITADWYLATDPLPGTYPVTLTAQSIAGAVTAVQGQYDFGDLFFTGSSPTTFNLNVPASPVINSLVLYTRISRAGGNYLGPVVSIFGANTLAFYYVGRPFANLGNTTPYGQVPATVAAVIPFPGAIETQISVTVTPTGSAQADLRLIGFEGVTPPFSPPPLVTSAASLVLTNTNTGAVVAGPTDGRGIRVWSIDLTTSTATMDANVFASGGGPNLATILAGVVSYSKAFPNGFYVPPGQGITLSTSGTGQAQTDLTYDYY